VIKKILEWWRFRQEVKKFERYFQLADGDRLTKLCSSEVLCYHNEPVVHDVAKNLPLDQRQGLMMAWLSMIAWMVVTRLGERIEDVRAIQLDTKMRMNICYIAKFQRERFDQIYEAVQQGMRQAVELGPDMPWIWVDISLRKVGINIGSINDLNFHLTTALMWQAVYQSVDKFEVN
jgi:hypothetical protein